MLTIILTGLGLVLSAHDGGNYGVTAEPMDGGEVWIDSVSNDETRIVPASMLGATVGVVDVLGGAFTEYVYGGACDIDGDGDSGTDADISMFLTWAGDADPRADWNQDGVVNSADVAAFFCALAGG